MAGIFRHPPQPWQIRLLAAGLALPATLSPGGIASGFVSGSHTVKATINISPSGIASGFAAGTPGASELWTIGLDPQLKWWRGWRRPWDFHQPRWASGLPFPATVSPGGIVSGFASGAHSIKGAIALSPTSIASGFVAGSENISRIWTIGLDPQLKWWRGWKRPWDFHQNWPRPSSLVTFPISIYPGGIATKIAIGVPKLSGPVAPVGIPSGFVAGLPYVNKQQRLSPGGIPSAAVFGHPILSQGKTLFPSGIPSGFIAGTAKVTGGPHTLHPFGIPPGLAGIPTLVGGAQGLEIFLAGAPMFHYNKVQQTRVASQTIGRWTCEFTLYDPVGLLQVKIGQTCLVMEFGRKLFAGCLSKVVITRNPQSPAQLNFACTATDKSGICDHRVITGNTYPAAMDAADAIRDIVAKYLNGEGITTQGVPASLGALGSDLIFNFNTVTNGFDQIATLTGTVWWVDVNGVLNFSSFTTLPAAPFSLDDTSSNWRNLSVEQSLIDYRNKEYAISNLNAVPPGSGGGAGAGVTEAYTMTTGITDPFTSFIFGRQNDAYLHGLPDGYLWTTLPIGSVIAVIVNGTSYPALQAFQASGPPPPAGAYFAWYGQAVFPVVWGHEGLQPSDVVQIQYLPTVAAGVQTGVALDPGGVGPLAGTCGSGVYEHVTQAINLSLKTDLDAVAAAELARSGGVPTLVTFETDNPGLAPGQKIAVNIPGAGINKSLMITGVAGLSYAVDLGHKSSFRWVVTASSNQDPGNWIKWYERLRKRSDLPLPIDRFEQWTFILGAGGSLSQGNLVANPDIVGNTSLLFELMIAAAQPPVEQDLTVTLVAGPGGGRVIGSITLPSTATPNQLIDVLVPAAPAIYMFAKDVLNLNVSYRVTGPNPLPAGMVTFRARAKF